MATFLFGGFLLMAQEPDVEDVKDVKDVEDVDDMKDVEDVDDMKDVEDTAKTLRVEDLNFLFDETVTKMGRDFFRNFHSEWENPSNVEGVSILVGEKPAPGMSTQLWIKVDERIIFRTMLRPNPEQLRQEVERALSATRDYFVNYETIQKQLNSEDYSGNGLF
ncbi:MAG: CsgE family curli-type amyloid fiber assembly protein [Marinilabilia sp.]